MWNVRTSTIAGASSFALAVIATGPVWSQSATGLQSDFEVETTFDATRNPSLTPGNDDVRSTLTTVLEFSVSTETARSELVFSAGANLRYSFGDGAGTDDGFVFDGPSLGLSYGYRAPNATITSSLNYSRSDLAFVTATDLIEDTSDGLTVVEDFDGVSGTGTREDLSYRVSAEFYEDRPFSYAATISGTELMYSGVGGSSLEDTSAFSAVLSATYDVIPTVQLSTSLLYTQGETETSDRTSTTALNLGMTALRSDNLSVSANLVYEMPDDSDDRITLTAGITAAPTARSSFSATAGVVFGDNIDTQFIGGLRYSIQPTSTSQFDLGFNSTVTDSVEGDVVVNTVATAGADFTLTSLTSLSMDAIYAQQQDLTADTEDSELSTSVQLNRQLTRDWQMSVGVGTTTRREDASASATAESVFISIGRNWQGSLF